MQFSLNINIPALEQPITHHHRILLTGSCFTEHISERLSLHKFRNLSNPHGILFNPLSVCTSLESYINGKIYTREELFYLNELWNSWDHHTRFSDIEPGGALQKINTSQQEAAGFIREADWIIITLGSAFQYYLVDGDRPVANNHRAPAQWFRKKLLPISVITDALSATISKIRSRNPKVRFLFTVSPVRHIRDGVVDNNRSKARLLEAVHSVCESNPGAAIYFPAYELVIDILRDYRFYDIDFVHPNYMATEFVWEHFMNACLAPATRQLLPKLADIHTARSHKPRFPGTESHRKFMNSYREKVLSLQQEHPELDLSADLAYFSV